MNARCIDLQLDRANPERRALTNGVRAIGGRDQRFRRHATGVEAIAAHFASLDEDDFAAELRRARRNGQSA